MAKNDLNTVPTLGKTKGLDFRGIITILRWTPFGWVLDVIDLDKRKKAKKNISSQDQPIKVPSNLPHHTGPVRCKDY